jgi:hypothetical protein
VVTGNPELESYVTALSVDAMNFEGDFVWVTSTPKEMNEEVQTA